MKATGTVTTPATVGKIELDWPDAPQPPVPPEPPGGLEPWSGNKSFKNEEGLVLENFALDGRLRLENCPGALIRNFQIRNGVADKWGPFILDNCPGAKIDSGLVMECREGHGIYLEGDIQGIAVNDVQLLNNQEDGIQTKNAAGLLTLNNLTVKGNGENAGDFKAGDIVINGGLFEGQATGDEADEILMLQNAGKTLVVNGATLDDQSGSRQKALAVIYQGHGTFENCLYKINRGNKWFRTSGNKSPGYSMADLGDPFDLDVAQLRVIGGRQIPDD